MSNGNALLSQTFINPGAEWVFWNNVDGGGYTAYTSWKYTEDVTIDTLSYQKITISRRNSIPFVTGFPESGGYTELFNLDPFLFRSSADSLFIAEIDGSNERLLYDLTPVIGNSWDVSPFITAVTVEPTSPLIIETIGFGDTLINGQNVNWVDVVSSNPDSLIFSGRIYNHFGKQQLFPAWNDGTLHNNPRMWRCYYDDILGPIGFSPCIDIETLAVNAIKEIEISVIPNYNSKQIKVLINNKYQLELISISDLSGRNVNFEYNEVNNSIQFTELSGVYVITAKFKDLIYTEKFLWSEN
jgi:hypothetical protein